MIACSAPTVKSITKFWQMVWEQKVGLIIMVCPFIGVRGEESVSYWNIEEVGESFDIDDVFTIKLVEKKDATENIVKRVFEVRIQMDSSNLCFAKQSSGPFEQASSKGD
jgi:protein tyrosine phosphatase